MNQDPNVVTPGFKTTEFVTSLIPMVLGLILMIFGMIQKNNELANQGVALLLGGSGGYAIARGLTKMGNGIGPIIPTPNAVVPSSDVEAAKVIAKLP